MIRSRATTRCNCPRVVVMCGLVRVSLRGFGFATDRHDRDTPSPDSPPRHTLFTAVMVAAGSITVAVRVRPPTTWEAARLPETVADNLIRCDAAFSAPTPRPAATQSSLRNIVQIIDDRVLTFDPEERDASRAFVERGFLPPGTKRYKDRRFIFDRVFRHDTTQHEVFEGTAKPLLKNVLDGYNATIFAYGVSLVVSL